MKTKFNRFFFLILLMLSTVVMASDTLLESQRKQFQRAEKLIRKGDDTAFFNALLQLKDYPLYPYLHYQWLLKHLNESQRIKDFLAAQKRTRYAGLLKYKWQFYLAKHKNWADFTKQYRHSNNLKLQCYFFLAKYHQGDKREALLGAKRLWVRGKSLPKECNEIFEQLKNSRYFTGEMVWQRFNSALKNKNVQLAKYLIRYMNKRDRATALRWLKVDSNPLLVVKPSFLNKKQPQSGMIFAHGIDRMASKNLAKAISIWDARKNNFKINTATKQHVEKRLAMALAYRRDNKAYKRLSQLDKPDEEAQEWRVRTALVAQDWLNVEQSIAELEKPVKKKDKWKYWLARAMEETKKPTVANFMFKQLAKERSYYGYLAADKLNRGYQLVDRPIQVAEKRFERFKQKTDFRVVAELIKMDKRREARRQWWYAIKKLNKKELLMAAKYAQELNWKQVAIFTIAKAQHWDDISLRFPLAYEKLVMKNARRQNLSPAVIFGLIRRESAFNQNARSQVGAQGLMQIMPKTGQQIARELKEKWNSTGNLLDPSVNVKYGAYYYKQLLKKFRGHYALAAAAYNAGPHRVNRWLPKRSVMAADVWIETIPFKETRAYVSAVLTYALIYQKKLKKNVLTMRDFMRDVFPKK